MLLFADDSASNNTNKTDKGLFGFSGSTSQFLVSFLINVIVTTICLLLFSFLRTRLKRVFSPRLLLLDTMFPLGKIPNSCFAWIMPAFMTSDDDVFYYAGIDALMYLRFMKLCLKISLVILPYGLAVLLPLNYYGGNKLSELEELAMSNLKQGSSKMWAHLLGIWVYTLVMLYLLLEEWKVYSVYRQEHLAKGYQNQYVVLVRDLPGKVSQFRNYLLECFFSIDNQIFRPLLKKLYSFKYNG